MFVRMFVDENLDRHVPISKQPKEKIQVGFLDSSLRNLRFLDVLIKLLQTAQINFNCAFNRIHVFTMEYRSLYTAWKKTCRQTVAVTLTVTVRIMLPSRREYAWVYYKSCVRLYFFLIQSRKSLIENNIINKEKTLFT